MDSSCLAFVAAGTIEYGAFIIHETLYFIIISVIISSAFEDRNNISHANENMILILLFQVDACAGPTFLQMSFLQSQCKS